MESWRIGAPSLDRGETGEDGPTSPDQIWPSIDRARADIRGLLAELGPLDVDGLRHRADALRSQTRDTLPAWCALAAAMISRTLNVELHDNQLMASVALASGWSAQLRTGEGKTFAAIAPAMFYAASGTTVHVVTANAYLAERDADWSGRVLRHLGFTTGVTVPGLSRATTRAAYRAAVVFGAGSDFGFDYLRDNLYLPGDPSVQRGRGVAIIDEADAVLLDQARMPLVLSAAGDTDTELVHRVDEACRTLDPQLDVEANGALGRIALTDSGIARCEAALGVDNLFESKPVDWPHLIENSLRAMSLLQRDRDYVVQDGSIAVVDELTGRIVAGRRWADGLHQAVEAKEGLAVTLERRPIGRVTVGSYFGSCDRLVGMSGTLEGGHDELLTVYRTRCVELPTAKPIVRVDGADRAFASETDKLRSVADDVAVRHGLGQPTLVGTTSIAKSMSFSALLAERAVPHRTLSATNDAEEAAVIADAGRWGAVTVATQMAGRGVDIVLGGSAGGPDDHAAVVAAGGLMVWGLEHYASRRQDAQLRGRAGRQGDPGESCFAVSGDDELATLADIDAPAEQRTTLGQLRAEELDEELRSDVRAFETVTDKLHDHLYRWRQETVDSPDPIGGLDAAVVALRERAPAQLLALVPDSDARRGARRRRHDEAAGVLRAALRAREAELGDGVFGDLARLVLQTLLVVLWPDELDQLEQNKALYRTGPFREQTWIASAVPSYQRFEVTVKTEWVRQMLHFRLESGPAPRSPHGEQSSLVLPGAVPGQGAEPERQLPGHHPALQTIVETLGRHFGARLEDPPIVLAVDSIGDRASDKGLHLRLDLDDATRTVVYRAVP